MHTQLLLCVFCTRQSATQWGLWKSMNDEAYRNTWHHSWQRVSLTPTFFRQSQTVHGWAGEVILYDKHMAVKEVQGGVAITSPAKPCTIFDCQVLNNVMFIMYRQTCVRVSIHCCLFVQQGTQPHCVSRQNMSSYWGTQSSDTNIKLMTVKEYMLTGTNCTCMNDEQPTPNSR